MPAVNAAVPFSFWRRLKKARVFWTPIMSVRPIRKRICFVLLVLVGVELGGGLFGGDVRCPLPDYVLLAFTLVWGMLVGEWRAGKGRTENDRRREGRRRRGRGLLFYGTLVN